MTTRKPSQKKRLLFITGSRSDFATTKKIFWLMQKSHSLDPLLFVTGTHFMKRYGETHKEILRNKIPIAGKLEIQNRNALEDYAAETKSISKFILDQNIDYVIVCGDRVEMLAAATAALFNQVPIFHIHGGDVSFGMLDDALRHATTKMSSIHFPATKLSAKRIAAMGEETWRIHTAGSPDIDELAELKNERKLNTPKLLRALGLQKKSYCILVFHPETLAGQANQKYVRSILKALRHFHKKLIIMYPNNDKYSELIVKEYDSLSRQNVLMFKTLEREKYLVLLKNAQFLIGNSSSGIIEAATFQTPVINLGHRQDGRERNKNTLDVPNITEEKIKAAIKKTLSSKWQKKMKHVENVYGSGSASLKIFKKIIQIVKNYSKPRLLYKEFVL